MCTRKYLVTNFWKAKILMQDVDHCYYHSVLDVTGAMTVIECRVKHRVISADRRTKGGLLETTTFSYQHIIIKCIIFNRSTNINHIKPNMHHIILINSSIFNLHQSIKI